MKLLHAPRAVFWAIRAAKTLVGETENGDRLAKPVYVVAADGAWQDCAGREKHQLSSGKWLTMMNITVPIRVVMKE